MRQRGRTNAPDSSLARQQPRRHREIMQQASDHRQHALALPDHAAEQDKLEAITGPLTDEEAGRLAVLKKARAGFNVKERAYGAALAAGNLEHAEDLAQDVLAGMKAVAK